jgi:hypothetical protein
MPVSEQNVQKKLVYESLTVVLENTTEIKTLLGRGVLLIFRIAISSTASSKIVFVIFLETFAPGVAYMYPISNEIWMFIT